MITVTVQLRPWKHLSDRTNLVRKIAQTEVSTSQEARLHRPQQVQHRHNTQVPGDQDDDSSFHASTKLNSTELPDFESISPEFLNILNNSKEDINDQ